MLPLKQLSSRYYFKRLKRIIAIEFWQNFPSANLTPVQRHVDTVLLRSATCRHLRSKNTQTDRRTDEQKH